MSLVQIETGIVSSPVAISILEIRSVYIFFAKRPPASTVLALTAKTGNTTKHIAITNDNSFFRDTLIPLSIFVNPLEF